MKFQYFPYLFYLLNIFKCDVNHRIPQFAYFYILGISVLIIKKATLSH